jgi:hypothetical protein
MTAPYLLAVVAGDSNAGNGKFFDASLDVRDSNVFQIKHDLTTVQIATEPLDNAGIPARCVGSTLALCRLLSQRGKIPTGYKILIVPCAWAGTAFANYWATTGNRYALDGGGGIGNGLYAMVNAALALDSRNRIWFFDWNHGENDNTTQDVYQNNMIATWGEIRSRVSTALRAPILVAGEPPNRSNPLLGHTPNPGVDAALRNVATYLDSSIYINSDDLTAIDNTSGYVHFPAASHRGGTNNAPGNRDEVVTNPLSERKYAALLQLGWRIRASW